MSGSGELLVAEQNSKIPASLYTYEVIELKNQGADDSIELIN